MPALIAAVVVDVGRAAGLDHSSGCLAVNTQRTRHRETGSLPQTVLFMVRGTPVSTRLHRERFLSPISDEPQAARPLVVTQRHGHGRQCLANSRSATVYPARQEPRAYGVTGGPHLRRSPDPIRRDPASHAIHNRANDVPRSTPNSLTEHINPDRVTLCSETGGHASDSELRRLWCCSQ